MTAGDATRDIEDIYRLAPMQQGMLFHTLYAPQSGMYVEQTTCLLHGSLDVSAFRDAWAKVVQRHSALRTAFAWEQVDAPVQMVFRAAEIPWHCRDLRNQSPDEQRATLESLMRGDRLNAFALDAQPLMRLSLIQLSDDATQFLWSFHHLLLDGWSVAILLNEVFECYRASRERRAARLSPITPYRDYIAHLAHVDATAARSYWQRLLADVTTPTPIPIERAGGARSAEPERFGQVECLINAVIARDISQSLRDHQVTFSTLVHCAWALLLARFSGESDVVFGSVVSGRSADLPGSEQIVGLLVNTIPVRIQIDQGRLVHDWLRETQNRQALSRHYDLVPLVDIQKWSGLPHDLPLFHSIVAVENYPNDFSKMEDFPGLKIDDVRSVESTNYPLTLTAEVAGTVRCRVLFDRHRVDAQAATALLQSFEFILRQLSASMRQPISSLALMSPDECRRTVVEWNDTQRPFPDQCGVHDLVATQCARTPHATAVVVAGAQSLSYAALDCRANQLVAWLASRGVARGDRIALFLERSPELMVAVLATLKVGAACVPLDRAYPAARLQLMLRDAAVRLILTTSDVATLLPPCDASIARLDQLRAELDAKQPSAPAVRSSPDDLAYILYTSGSSGQPKGVAMPHRALCNLIDWQVRSSGAIGALATLQYSPISFDVSFQEIFSTWCAGGTLVLIDEESRRNPDQLLEIIAREHIARLFLPFVALQQLANAFCEAAQCLPLPLREVITAGEQLQITPQIVRLFEALPDGRLHNQYGPTETHVVTAHELTGPPSQWPVLPPIGCPIPNVRAYVLDTALRPLPIGAIGELCLGGVALAQGYFNRPDLSRDRFVPDPFAEPPGSSRLYRSGDRVRWSLDGELEFLGRVDSQIKLRGYRIELGEIEATLLAHPAVQQATVIARADDTARAAQLVAYVVLRAQPPVPTDQLLGFLASRLPDYMVPSAVVTMPSLPLTPSGKLDRRSLPHPSPTSSRPHAAAITPTQTALVQIWSQVLKLPSIGIHDDFFELGGHSLLATQVLSRLRQTFDVNLTLRVIFDNRSIARLAEAIDLARLSSQGLTCRPLLPVSREGPIPLSFAQERMWFLDRLEPESAEYNLPISLRLTGELSPDALKSSIDQIVARHEILRTTISSQGGRPFQITHDTPWPFEVIDLQLCPVELRNTQSLTLARDFARRPFDLALGPLGRTLLVKLSPHEHLLTFVIHHIVADGWSLGILVRELMTFYEAQLKTQNALLPPLPIQYADFAAWQRQSMENDWTVTQLEYWKRELKELPPPLVLPTDRRRLTPASARGASEPFRLNAKTFGQVKRLAGGARATLFITLLAAFQLLLHRLTQARDILVGTAVANRSQLDLEHLIGCFINPLPLRARFDGPQSFLDLLDRVRETALGAFANQELPFERVVSALETSRDLYRNPIFQVMFIHQNAPLPPLQLPGLTLELVDPGGGSAAFDLLLTTWETGDELHGLMEYRADLFDAATIRDLLSRFQLLIESITHKPDEPVSSLLLMTPDERRRLLLEWNHIDDSVSTSHSVCCQFYDQVGRTPNAIALASGVATLTYAELAQRVDDLSNRLAALDIKSSDRVGLLLERSDILIVALLSVLKCGATYVPLDPNHPAQRLTWISRDASVKLILTHRSSTARQCDFTVPLIVIDNQSPPLIDSALPPSPPADIAYILYTSGSTGEPKGVEIPHSAFANFVAWAADAYQLSLADRVLQFASISFDASVEEIYPALTRGATLVLRNDEMLGAATRFLEYVGRFQVTVLDLPTSYWHTLTIEMIDHDLPLPTSVRLVILGGEAPRSDLLAAWRNHVGTSVRLLNTYGPTEATVVATMADLTGIPHHDLLMRDPPIGRPIANVQAYVLDQELQPVPTGFPGELYLAGAGLARGYLNQPQLTADRFRPNPFADSPASSRIYRTGDRARWRADGNLEFLGRSDAQFKLRGYRIEPGEIEAALLSHPQVRQAAVILQQDTHSNQQRLIAYLATPSKLPDPTGTLRAFLASRLPAYMIPSSFIILPSFPQTSSGKIDRQALSKLQRLPSPDRRYEPPQTETQCAVAKIWADVLKIDRIGLHESFFDLGGHSLLAAQLLARIESYFNRQLSLRALLETPTVAAIAAAIDAPDTSVHPITATSSATLRADAQLDNAIHPSPGPLPDEVKHIFLTGATGFLGAAMLAELLHVSSDVVIHCLVRADGIDHALKRLRSSLQSHCRSLDSVQSRVRPIVGDLAKPLLGLSPHDFAHLATTIDAIYHCGAAVSAIQPYPALRAPNVAGVTEILRLACQSRPRHLHYISTLAVWASPAYFDQSEILETSDPIYCEGLDGGYTQSKWVAEHLVLQARARGLPVSIYRPGLITGHSRTGLCKSDDLTLAAARLCIDLGILPTLDISLDLIPVDYTAAAIVHLSRQPTSAGRIFHLCNPHPISWTLFGQWLRRQGYNLTPVDPDQLATVTCAHDDPASIAALKMLVGSDRHAAPASRIDDHNTRTGLSGSPIQCPPVDDALLATYLAHFIRTGQIAPPA